MSASWSAWFLLGLAWSGSVPAAEEKVLNVYNWADYIAPDTIAVFEKEFGIRVNYDLYDATAVVEAKLLAGSTGYDVVLQALRFVPAFMYNVDMVRERMPDAPVDSAAMLFDPAVVARFADCGISLLDESSTVIPLVMLYLGYQPHSMDLEQLAEAEAVLKSVRPYIRYFDSTKGLNDLPSKNICIAMAWSRVKTGL